MLCLRLTFIGELGFELHVPSYKVRVRGRGRGRVRGRVRVRVRVRVLVSNLASSRPSDKVVGDAIPDSNNVVGDSIPDSNQGERIYLSLGARLSSTK